MDVLSDMLRAVRLSGAVFLNARLALPWSVLSPPASDLAQFLDLPSDCVTLFHVLVEGPCMVALADQQAVYLESGDVLILPRGTQHVIGSDQRTLPTPIHALLPPLTSERIPAIVSSGPGDSTRLVCGYLHCERQFNPLLGALPEVLVVSNRYGRGQAPNANSGVARVEVIQPGERLETMLRYTVEEADCTHPGSAVMLTRLVEILFVEVLRRYMSDFPPAQRGWLAGVRDPIVGQALHLLHASPEHAWTVEELAHALAVSRATLADRFTELIGEPPMRYLTQWRMQLAERLLRQTDMSVVAVAGRVGYTSEPAFNRAFKRHVGHPPASWRLSEA